ncbi:bifunctional riboflavin kinase/FAD synthetase [Sulfurovum sp. XGS-02]|uniref:bifunctional riboflavin kinase/FAD synthetase n=1 Tax=Sulfurovum sp. XGS-02 TaxID=2925411 RepID=UPI00206BC84B|nr:bifunctional riboflavin kinase/FAD synthetase [Sulfurovum sp. XGS-02]UPT77939.1 bifunctional riboflavin kinase/FAD synthetase [Sulfurovum sp. XGS-02]
MPLLNQIKRIAIGSFDGIHLGHQALIDKVDALVIIERNSGYLTPGYKRSLFTSKVCCFYHFDKIKSLTPEAFVDKLEADFPALETIVVGYDFHFGKNKAGNGQMMKMLTDKEISIVDQVTLGETPVHSRIIKTYLREGKIKRANQLLGRTYHIEGRVVPGQGLGKKELVPTINLHVKEYQLPLEGVYATHTWIDGQRFDSVSFLGHRVTTDDSYAVETHILDQEIAEVKGEIMLEFVDFIRINQKFDSLDALREQIFDDINVAKKRLLHSEA